MKRSLLPLAAAALAVTGLGLYAFAQTTQIKVNAVPIINSGDLVPLAQQGTGQVPTAFANAGLVGATLYRQTVVPITAFTITPAAGTTLLFLNPAGTLATGTITMPANPGDAQLFCWMSTQTQTAVTVSANTGQSLVGTAVTAGVAGTQYCWRYIASTATWYRQQ